MLKLIPGPQTYPENEHEFFGQGLRKGGSAYSQKKVLVYYIGGVTFAEIAAIRFLNKLFTDKKFIIATTSIISGNKCMKQMRTCETNNLDLATVVAMK